MAELGEGGGHGGAAHGDEGAGVALTVQLPEEGVLPRAVVIGVHDPGPPEHLLHRDDLPQGTHRRRLVVAQPRRMEVGERDGRQGRQQEEDEEDLHHRPSPLPAPPPLLVHASILPAPSPGGKQGRRAARP